MKWAAFQQPAATRPTSLRERLYKKRDSCRLHISSMGSSSKPPRPPPPAESGQSVRPTEQLEDNPAYYHEYDQPANYIRHRKSQSKSSHQRRHERIPEQVADREAR